MHLSHVPGLLLAALALCGSPSFRDRERGSALLRLLPEPVLRVASAWHPDREVASRAARAAANLAALREAREAAVRTERGRACAAALLREQQPLPWLDTGWHDRRLSRWERGEAQDCLTEAHLQGFRGQAPDWLDYREATRLHLLRGRVQPADVPAFVDALRAAERAWTLRQPKREPPPI